MRITLSGRCYKTFRRQSAEIVIAKWMLRDTEIFLLDEPTRGIDIGAKFEIYNLIHELTKQKKAVILVSPEMEELIGTLQPGICHV